MYKYENQTYKTPFAIACTVAGCALLGFTLMLLIIHAQTDIIVDNTNTIKDLQTEVSKENKLINKLNEDIAKLNKKVEELPQ